MTDVPSIDLTGKTVDQAALDGLTSIGAPRRLVGADLGGLVFGEVDLAGWQFEGCYLAHCKLVRTRLADSRWSACKGAFADFGRVWDSRYAYKNPLANRIQQGYGIGVNVVTSYDQVMRVEFAVNGRAASGFYLHFAQPF